MAVKGNAAAVLTAPPPGIATGGGVSHCCRNCLWRKKRLHCTFKMYLFDRASFIQLDFAVL